MKSNEKKPDVWVVSTKDRGRKSIKNGKVYLKDGEEFEIEFYNPLNVSVLADIKLNGLGISKNGLVIKSGQRIYLDCYIEDKRKFKFSTYNVENTEEVLDAIKQNGLLEVFFYREVNTQIYIPINYPTYPLNPTHPTFP
jgi:predicted nucleotidyltransferase